MKGSFNCYYSQGCLQVVCFGLAAFAKKPFNSINHHPNSILLYLTLRDKQPTFLTICYSNYSHSVFMSHFLWFQRVLKQGGHSKHLPTAKTTDVLVDEVVGTILPWLEPCWLHVFFPNHPSGQCLRGLRSKGPTFTRVE